MATMREMLEGADRIDPAKVSGVLGRFRQERAQAAEGGMPMGSVVPQPAARTAGIMPLYQQQAGPADIRTREIAKVLGPDTGADTPENEFIRSNAINAADAMRMRRLLTTNADTRARKVLQRQIAPIAARREQEAALGAGREALKFKTDEAIRLKEATEGARTKGRLAVGAQKAGFESEADARKYEQDFALLDAEQQNRVQSIGANLDADMKRAQMDHELGLKQIKAEADEKIRVAQESGDAETANRLAIETAKAQADLQSEFYKGLIDKSFMGQGAEVPEPPTSKLKPLSKEEVEEYNELDEFKRSGALDRLTPFKRRRAENRWKELDARI